MPAPARTSILDAGERRRVLRQGVSVGAASGLYGVSFGALSTASGLSVLQTCLLSLVMFAGSAQFAFVSVLGAGGAGITAITSSALLAFRSSFYAIQLAPVLAVRGPRRWLAAQLTVDEPTMVSTAQETGPARRFGFWVTGLAVYLGWNASTLVGAIIGNTLGDPRRYGLDAAAACAFLALLWPRLRRRDVAAVAALAAVVATVTTPVLPAGVPILAAAGVAIAVGLLSDGPSPTPPISTADGSGGQP